jgi:hypothetical protein
VGIVTFDAAVHAYHITPGQAQARMLVMPDTAEPYAPMPAAWLSKAGEAREQLTELLAAIPGMFAGASGPEAAGAAALEVGVGCLGGGGGWQNCCRAGEDVSVSPCWGFLPRPVRLGLSKPPSRFFLPPSPPSARILPPAPPPPHPRFDFLWLLTPPFMLPPHPPPPPPPGLHRAAAPHGRQDQRLHGLPPQHGRQSTQSTRRHRRARRSSRSRARRGGRRRRRGGVGG